MSMVIIYTTFMAIKPLCDMCKIELDDFGAVVLSPPNKNGQVQKYHICKDCFKKITILLRNNK
jgi:hypothetical protein